jgi:hypothetical protein
MSSGRRARHKTTEVAPHPRGADLAEKGVQRATRLVYAVRYEGAWDVAQITDPCNRDDLVALCVALAAMVDVEASVSDLLAWVPGDVKDNAWTDDELRKAHAQKTAGRTDAWTTAGEREYQRRRKAHTRARREVAA